VYLFVSHKYILPSMSASFIYMKEAVMLSNLFYTTGQTGTKLETEQHISVSCKRYEPSKRTHSFWSYFLVGFYCFNAKLWITWFEGNLITAMHQD